MKREAQSKIDENDMGQTLIKEHYKEFERSVQEETEQSAWYKRTDLCQGQKREIVQIRTEYRTKVERIERIAKQFKENGLRTRRAKQCEIESNAHKNSCALWNRVRQNRTAQSTSLNSIV